MEILGTLVVSADDFRNIRKRCPGFLGAILYMKGNGGSGFSGLTVSEELEPTLKKTIQRILSNIYEDKEDRQGVYLRRDGTFKQGILAGKVGKIGSVEFTGVLARERRREQKIHELEGRISEITEIIVSLEKGITTVQEYLEKLQGRYQELPNFSEINVTLDQERECEYKLQRTRKECGKKETQERQLISKKNRQYQTMLQKRKSFPYGRTEEAYEEAYDALGEYSRIWQEIRQAVLQLRTAQEDLSIERDKNVQGEQLMDDTFAEKHSWNVKEKEDGTQIRQSEKYLNHLETAERADRLKQLKKEPRETGTERDTLKRGLAILGERLRVILENEPKLKESLRQEIIVEIYLRNYFEGEFALKLVFDRESRGVFECAKKAVSVSRGSDKNRGPTDPLQTLHQVY